MYVHVRRSVQPQIEQRPRYVYSLLFSTSRLSKWLHFEDTRSFDALTYCLVYFLQPKRVIPFLGTFLFHFIIFNLKKIEVDVKGNPISNTRCAPDAVRVRADMLQNYF